METALPYEFHSKPFEHQLTLHEQWLELNAFALLWEQGCGKTKPTIDKACWLYEHGIIDAVIVVAPNGVHRNWKTDELPAHMPERIRPKTRVEFWQSQKANTKWHAAQMEALVKHKGFAWLLISYNGFMTVKGKNYVWKFLRNRRCFYVLDEAHNIAKPGAKRTRAIVASSIYAPVKAILTGTPVSTGPFDLYSQIKFLDKDFWKRKGLDDYNVFKFHFGKWFTAAECKMLHGYDPGYDKLIEYRNVHQLNEWLKEISDRKLKADVLPHLPTKLYSKRYYELNGEQAKVYKELRDAYEYEFENGERIDGALVIVRLLRLHQIICGYAATDREDDEPTVMLGNHNPLMEQIEAVCDGLSHPAIIWARFTKDIDQLMDMLGSKAVRYDGKLTDDEAERSKLAFQKGDAQYFIGNQQKGGSGLTLVQAKTTMYASQSFRFIDRLQSEDRNHRIGQEGIPVEGSEKNAVNYIDFVGMLPDGKPTVAQHIIKNLVGKYDIAGKITGDQLREWL